MSMKSKVLTPAQAVELISSLPAYNLPLADLPLGGKFKVEFTAPDSFKGAIDKAEAYNFRARLHGEINANLSAVRFGYMQLLLEQKHLRGQGAFADASEVRTRHDVRAASLITITDYVKTPDGRQLDFYKANFKVVARFADVNRNSSVVGELKYKAFCYDGYNEFSETVSHLSRNSDDDRDEFRRASLKLYSSNLIAELAVTENILWVPVLSIT